MGLPVLSFFYLICCVNGRGGPNDHVMELSSSLDNFHLMKYGFSDFRHKHLHFPEIAILNNSYKIWSRHTTEVKLSSKHHASWLKTYPCYNFYILWNFSSTWGISNVAVWCICPCNQKNPIWLLWYVWFQRYSNFCPKIGHVLDLPSGARELVWDASHAAVHGLRPKCP